MNPQIDDIIEILKDGPSVKKESSYYKSVQAHYRREKDKERKVSEKKIAEEKRKEFVRTVFMLRTTQRNRVDAKQRIKIIRTMVQEGFNLMDTDLQAAVAIYSNLHPLYKDLPNNAKEEAYSEIVPFYQELETRLKIFQKIEDSKKI